MAKRDRNQPMFANVPSDRWLRVAVAVAEPSPSDICARYWKGQAALPVLEPARGLRKLVH